MREYETIYVLSPETSDSAAKDFMLKMKELVAREGGRNIKVDCWGRRKLAWDREKKQRGIFVHHLYLGKSGMVAEFERTLAIDESVILRQSVLVNPDVDLATRVEQPDQLEVPVVRERRDMPQRQDFDRYDDGMMGGPDGSYDEEQY
jgi:small subunit ribosomal protein S6